MNTLTQATAFLVVVALSSSSVVQSPSSGKNFELLILHNNDMHARFEQTSQLSGTCTPADRDAGKCYGGFPRVAYVVKEARKAAASGEGPPVLYLNAGDTYTGTAWFTIYKWKIAAEFVNALQPDAVSLGNHEFDNGVSGLTPFIENLTAPVLAANLILNKVPELEKQTNLKKSITFNVAGTRVGVVGYLTPETKILAVKNDVEYIDEVVALKEEVAKLQNEGIKIIIALGHSGYLRDLQIAKEVEGVDLVIGGHSNTFLWNGTSPDAEEIQGPYPTYVKQASGRTALVVQAYAYTKYLGKLHLVFDSNGEVIRADGQPILLDNSIPQDQDILQIVNRYGESLKSLTEVVGETSVVLDGLGCQLNECNLGNLIADAMFYTYTVNYNGENWTDVNMAMIQGGGVRSSIAHAEREITKADLINVMPFGGNLSIVTANGSIIHKMLEHSVASYDILDPPGELLHFSGMRVVFDLQKPPGKRVVTAKIRCTNCKIPEYFDVDENKTYKILCPRFLADGGDNYSMLVGLPTQVLNFNELYSTEFYLKHHSPVYPEVEGRVVYLNNEPLRGLSASLSSPLSLLSFIVLFKLYSYL